MQILKYEFIGKERYNIYLSNGEVLELYEPIITENELLLKKEIDVNLYSKINSDNEVYKFVEMAIKYISLRLRSIKEIEIYLERKKVSTDIIKQVVEKLIQKGYLDDDRFAIAFIKDKLNFTTMGDYKIKMELDRLGVSPSIIEKNINLIDELTVENKMKKIIEKDIRTNKKHSGIALKNKIYNHLLTSGYSKEKVINIINKYNF